MKAGAQKKDRRFSNGSERYEPLNVQHLLGCVVLSTPIMLLPSLSLIALSLFPSIFAYTSHDDEKRTLRQLSTSHLDALSTHDPALDTFLDWEMKDGMLNKLLIPRAR
jgi:hypothetical protein